LDPFVVSAKKKKKKMVSFYLTALCAIQWLLLAHVTESRHAQVVVREGDE
jgi:hypothetical protein